MCEEYKRMKKVLFVATVVKTHIMEFHVPYLRMLKEMGWETAVAARNDYENPEDCVIPYCDVFYNIPFERSPLHTSNRKAYKELKNVIEDGEYDLIHCHTPVGAMLARLAARRSRKRGTKVIYTAHGFHFFQGAPLKNWLLYYPAERFLARYTDVLVTINREDFERAKRFRTGKTVYIPGVGIDTRRFSVSEERGREKRKELGIKKEEFVLLSVGELNENKNHMLILQALKHLKEQGVLEGIRYLLCGSGGSEAQLKDMVMRSGLSECVTFLGYRSDIPEICGAGDLFLFMSLREGLPVALMEAMAGGLPVVCSDIRGNRDLVENGVNGFFAEMNAEDVATMICKLRENESLRKSLGSNAKQQIKQFELCNVLEMMKEIYVNEAT